MHLLKIQSSLEFKCQCWFQSHPLSPARGWLDRSLPGEGAAICILLLILLLLFGVVVGGNGLDLTSSSLPLLRGMHSSHLHFVGVTVFLTSTDMFDAAHVARVHMLVIFWGQVWVYLTSPPWDKGSWSFNLWHSLQFSPSQLLDVRSPCFISVLP